MKWSDFHGAPCSCDWDLTLGPRVCLGARPGMRVLEVGCGTGRNLVSALRRFPQAEFYGMDISSEMLATATWSLIS